jgi:hypothetical protein
MNRLWTHGLAPPITVSILAAVLLATGCSAATPAGSPVLAATNSLHRGGTALPATWAHSGLAGCTALLGAHQIPANDYRKIRSQFASSRWPGLRTAGLSYVDLIVALQTARADGYEAVWFYQRLSAACARHGWKVTPAGDKLISFRYQAGSPAMPGQAHQADHDARNPPAANR